MKTGRARAGLVSATGLLALLAAPAARACEIAMPRCESASNGRVSELYINPPGIDDVAVFFEYNAAGDRPESMMLVECKSRKGVTIQMPAGGDTWLPPQKVLDYLTEVAVSEQPYTLSQIRAGLKERGSNSRMTSLAAGHCGCDLPKMETVGCGAAP